MAAVTGGRGGGGGYYSIGGAFRQVDSVLLLMLLAVTPGRGVREMEDQRWATVTRCNCPHRCRVLWECGQVKIALTRGAAPGRVLCTSTVANYGKA